MGFGRQFLKSDPVLVQTVALGGNPLKRKTGMAGEEVDFGGGPNLSSCKVEEVSDRLGLNGFLGKLAGSLLRVMPPELAEALMTGACSLSLGGLNRFEESSNPNRQPKTHPTRTVPAPMPSEPIGLGR